MSESDDNYIGMGTDIPSSKLHIVGDATFDGSYLSTGNIYLDGTNTAPIITGISPGKSAFALGAGTNFSWFEFDEDDTFRIRPQTRANLEAGTHPTTSNYVEVKASGDLITSGSIGIGINPIKKLHVHESTANQSVHIQVSNAQTGSGATDGMLFGLSTGSAPDGVFWVYEDAAFRMATNGTERARISNTGEFGIGTTNPTEALDVVGKNKGHWRSYRGRWSW